MSSFPEMQWNSKWDWEKLQLMDWGLEDGGVINVDSFNLSVGGSGSGHSASDLGNHTYAKSSMSASSDSSPEYGIKTTGFGLEVLKRSSFGDFSLKMEQVGGDVSGTSPYPEASNGFAEPLIGLKLGKRTYFENSCSGGNSKSPSSVIPVSSTTATKKTKPPSPSTPIPRCQVEGCNADLSSAKEYHQKHRVCDTHSKCPKVIVGGLDRRFCQQCSRFHNLSEFDGKKRSCRKRLSDHNARRRKPQQETIQFNSSRLPSSYDGRQEMSFLVNNVPLHARNVANSDWENTHGSKFTITRAFPLKTGKAGGVPCHQKIAGKQPSHVMSMHSNTSWRSMELKSATSPGFSQGFKDSVFSFNVDAAPEFRCALSLLSNSSLGLFERSSISLDNPAHVSGFNMPQTVMHAIQQGVPLASSYIPNEQQATYPRMQTLSTDSSGSIHFEGNQVFKTCYGTDFCSSSLN